MEAIRLLGNEFGIYVHFPFCKKKCDYCDFNSYAGLDSLMSAYTVALIKEIERYLPQSRSVRTIYCGGGTPSYFITEFLIYILNYIREHFFLSRDQIETTLEINPGTINLQSLVELRNAGVNRLSIGLQATQDELLKRIGRIHTWDDFCFTYHLARDVGFNNIGLDLIFGLPGQTLTEWKETLAKVVNLSPNHISAYALQVESGTKLAAKVEAGEFILPSEDEVAAMMAYTMETLPLAGYEHYEISNYAKPGFRSEHNLNYWLGRDYLGFGAGAFSTFQGKRYCNLHHPQEYINALKYDQSLIVESEIIDEQLALKERLMLGLRLADGVNLNEFRRSLVPTSFGRLEREIDELVNLGLIRRFDNTIQLTTNAMMISNSIISRLLSVWS